MELLSGLNQEQAQAVTLSKGSALILAGAGSGKTRVLTTRMAWLIQNSLAPPHGILAVTFTNKAAKEMLTRLSAILPISTRGMWVGTFHGLCNRFLRTHPQDANLPPLFQILDSQDQLSAIKRLLRSMGVNEEQYPPKQLQHFINGNKEEGRRAQEALVHDATTRAMQDIYAQYEIQCQQEGVVDFAELLLRSVELLQRNSVLREHYQRRFTHILVDEFQDTNRLQYVWLKLLSGPHASVFAVGDDDQSIYGFRGAEVANMYQFEKDFGQPEIIRLEQNYRSYGNILDAANALIKNNQGRMGKTLWTEVGAGEPIRIYEAPTDQEEARFIVGNIKELNATGTALSDMAILYRSNAQSRVLEQTLFAAGVSYRVYGGLRFFERMEVKHALAYLRLVANQHDDGSFLRVVNFPPRGIGPKSIEIIQLRAQERATSLFQAASSLELSGKAGSGLMQFVNHVERWKEMAHEMSLPELTALVIQESTLAAHFKQDKDGADRVENLEELVAAANGFDHQTDLDDLSAFLSHASLEAGDHEAQVGADALQLMTVHAAKGLEFDVVFVSGLEEGLFPHDNALNDAKGSEEERRLMYVAITRARQRLTLTRAENRMLHGQVRYGMRSRFIDEIPESLCKYLTPNKKMDSFFDFSPSIKKTNTFSSDTTFSAKSLSPYRVGQNVSHIKFGPGVILAVEGSGEEGRVQVNFREVGVKWLALAYAKLSIG
ncbi:MAG: DNA helicase II [Ferrovum sp. 37-45-19]|jgi:DNA helicase-2/ATP-dependent DNA helicase PcrA|uniref:UvrD-helicase domain-containing protein n=1 Tax=Ferrovum sp. JA12 TaxID=1356299 RepID=UPI000703699F|nr:UvrD-helicase domain-containing protein [Ferrovum sp. JA12]OYV80497.1 MAG: DNA helicase II [Ferrovum sp. 21-44-67]OYV94812.1 MAG: DNA helicase II [Ferrovum sp. 37-45-19]OZB34155.1 MAG: DNA helicase II [Ferrovum sp. 34-44-207]HQT81062.1 3'-5' exonuclease [Ferrovaceae bacterium]KRH79213.1 DNA helicase II [Ferrovum sp. JA12]